MKLLRPFFFSLGCLLIAPAGFTEILATIQVKLTEPNRLYVPVDVALDSVNAKNRKKLFLVEIISQDRIPVPFQIHGDKQPALHWLVSAGNKTFRTYELVSGEAGGKSNNNAKLTQKSKDGVLTITANGNSLLAYQYAFMPAPQGVDPAYGRSGFIHPLWSPKGQVLTRVQPDDHFHHYGIWNPWTHLLFEGREVDLWNLAKKQGTVRFSKFVSRTEGPLFAEFSALHKHIVFGEEEAEKIAINEIQSVRVYRPAAQNYYLMDMTIALTPATQNPVKLLEYRYGGFGWRATREWNRNNSEMLSSEGKTRADIDNTNGRWFLAQGEVGNEYAGAAVMSHPENFNHPEPMRMWGIPEDPENRGDVFASFSPTRDRDWLLEPGKTYTRRYRFVVYSGKLDAVQAENGWQLFARPPAVKVITK